MKQPNRKPAALQALLFAALFAGLLLPAGLLAHESDGPEEIMQKEDRGQTEQSVSFTDQNALTPYDFARPEAAAAIDGVKGLKDGWVLDADEIDALLKDYSRTSYKELGLMGLLLSMGDLEGAAILAKGVRQGIVHLNAQGDPTSLAYTKKALNGLEDCNLLRINNHNLPALELDTTMMAIAAVQTAASKDEVGHSQLYPVGENLAWGYSMQKRYGQDPSSSPFSGWYDLEKPERPGERGGGHYENIINPDYTASGFAIADSKGWGLACGQTFTSSPVCAYAKRMTVDQFRKQIETFLNSPKLWIAPLEAERIEDADAGQASASIRMLRLYNPNSGEHFYTANENEMEMLCKAGWNFEGIGWVAPKSSSRPVYRLYNPNAGDHHYTTSEGERRHLLGCGWKDEGIGWYSADEKKGRPLYRQYNPNAKTGTHNYTMQKAENDHLVSLGWKGEGISWYALC